MLHARTRIRRGPVLGGLLVLGLLLVAAAPLRAQTILLVLLFGPKVSEENLHFAVKLGLNSARTTGVEDASSRWGFTYGVQLNIGLDEAGKWWLLPEFTPLSPKGVTSAGVVPAYIQGNPELDVLLANTTRTKTRFNFLDFPVILSYRPTPAIRVGAGPYAAFRTSAHSLFVTSADPVGEIEIDKNSGDFYQRWDFGAAVEVGYSPWGKFTRGRPTILLRYQWGFVDLLRDNPGPAIRNRLLQIAAVFPYLPRKDKDEPAVDE